VCGGSKKRKICRKTEKISFSQKQFFTILNGIGEVWGCPGGGHGPYEDIVSNFGRVWSYRTWGKSIFMFLGNIGNSLHHQIHPNWSSGLQMGLGISPNTMDFWWNCLRQKSFLENDTPTNIFPGMANTSKLVIF